MSTPSTTTGRTADARSVDAGPRHGTESGNGPDTDPRKVRSRARLLDAATELLTSGGLEAITIDAVTRTSNVARTTLYRHFDNVVQLRVATLAQTLPAVVEAPAEGTLRERLIVLLNRWADVINGAPLHVTTLAWLSIGEGGDHGVDSLRDRLIDSYRRPFDELFDSAEGRATLGERELLPTLAQLLGPLVFARLSGIITATPADCTRVVDDFLAACAASNGAAGRAGGAPGDGHHS